MRGVIEELSEQLKRIRIIAYTERGKLVVTDGHPRVHARFWKRVVIGYSDEPWDHFTNSRTAVKIELEKIGGKTTLPDGTILVIPNWYIAQISLSGWYRQEVYIDDKLVMTKPQVSIWERLNEVQPGYCLFKLGEHSGVILPWNFRIRWLLKWALEARSSRFPPLARVLRRRRLIDKIVGLEPWVKP